MYVLTNVVGTNYAVYDDSDNSVEWIKADVLKQLISKGITIVGVNPVSRETKPQVIKMNYRDINWNDGKNIFQTASSVRMDAKGNMSFKSGAKKYKAKVMSKSDGSAVLMLSNGVQTMLPAEVVGYLKGRQ